MRIVNWSRNLRFQAREVLYPASNDEVAEVITQCVESGQALRVIGNRGSQVPFVDTEDVIISLQRMNQILDFDSDSGVIRVQGGGTLKQIVSYLRPLGYTLGITPGVLWQTVAGALSTDTHGIGLSKNILHEDVLEITLVDGCGQVRVINREDEDFNSAAVSLGMLGVIVEVQLQTSPAFKMKTRVQSQSIESFLDHYPPKSYSQMYSWVIGTPYLIQQQFERSESGDKKILNGKIAPLFNLIGGNFLACCFSRLPKSMRSRVGVWFTSKQFAIKDDRVRNTQAIASHLVCRLNDVEMACDLHAFPALLKDLIQLIEAEASPSWSVANIRFAKANSAYLSLASGRDAAYISFWFRSQSDKGLIEKVYQLMRQHEARPHWGKMHNYRYPDLQRVYDRLDDFKSAANRFDPNGVFINKYCASLFQ